MCRLQGSAPAQKRGAEGVFGVGWGGGGLKNGAGIQSMGRFGSHEGMLETYKHNKKLLFKNVLCL
jgi:hypothetical protein